MVQKYEELISNPKIDNYLKKSDVVLNLLLTKRILLEVVHSGEKVMGMGSMINDLREIDGIDF